MVGLHTDHRAMRNRGHYLAILQFTLPYLLLHLHISQCPFWVVCWDSGYMQTNPTELTCGAVMSNTAGCWYHSSGSVQVSQTILWPKLYQIIFISSFIVEETVPRFAVNVVRCLVNKRHYIALLQCKLRVAINGVSLLYHLAYNYGWFMS
jgi:hypothetical protein